MQPPTSFEQYQASAGTDNPKTTINHYMNGAIFEANWQSDQFEGWWEDTHGKNPEILQDRDILKKIKETYSGLLEHWGLCGLEAAWEAYCCEVHYTGSNPPRIESAFIGYIILCNLPENGPREEQGRIDEEACILAFQIINNHVNNHQTPNP